jgi:chemotaxis signal transduction protein
LGFIDYRDELISILNVEKFFYVPEFEKNFIVLFFYNKKRYGIYIKNSLDIVEIEDEKIIQEITTIPKEIIVGSFHYNQKIIAIMNIENFVWNSFQN